MRQPSLVVFDDQGRVVPECTWSWCTMDHRDTKDLALVPYRDKQVALVTVRPDMTDLLASILDRRAVNLTSTHEDINDILYTEWLED
mmetsp:Transcript_3892/g.12072  ORF Transcript_3892/g.12072 Transcript_3892/m.12072 type:complete len:87 (-) Transcript_3892:211-471(-)